MKKSPNYKTIIKFVVTIIGICIAAYRIYQFLNKSGLLLEIKQRYKQLESKASNQVAEITQEGRDFVEDQAAYWKDELPVIKQNIDNSLIKMTKSVEAELTPRSSLLLNYIKQKSPVTMNQISDKFPSVTSRTLRRDLDKLEQLGFVTQEGKTRNSYYKYSN